MPDDIRKSEKGGNAVYLNVGAWYDKDTGHIHLTLPNSGWFHTTVSPNPESKRGHPNLFSKLARALNGAGVPAPEISGPDTIENARVFAERWVSANVHNIPGLEDSSRHVAQLAEEMIFAAGDKEIGEEELEAAIGDPIDYITKIYGQVEDSTLGFHESD